MDALLCTRFRLSGTIITLLIAVVVGIAFQTGWICRAISFAYAMILVLGLIGARRHNTKLLRFYWVFQFITLVLTAIALIVALSFLVYHITHHDNTSTDKTKTDNSKMFHNQVAKSIGFHGYENADTEEKDVVEPEVVTDPHSTKGKDDIPTKPKPTTPKTTTQTQIPRVYLIIISAVIFLIFTIVKVRSIILARSMIDLLEASASTEVPDIERGEESSDVNDEKKVAPVFVVSPTQLEGYNLVPIYVDRNGNPVN